MGTSGAGGLWSSEVWGLQGVTLQYNRPNSAQFPAIYELAHRFCEMSTRLKAAGLAKQRRFGLGPA